jgi:hypothetical protein
VLLPQHKGRHHNKFCLQISSGKTTKLKTTLTVGEKSTIDPAASNNKAADFFHHSPALTG